MKKNAQWNWLSVLVMLSITTSNSYAESNISCLNHRNDIELLTNNEIELVKKKKYDDVIGMELKRIKLLNCYEDSILGSEEFSVSPIVDAIKSKNLTDEELLSFIKNKVSPIIKNRLSASYYVYRILLSHFKTFETRLADNYNKPDNNGVFHTHYGSDIYRKSDGTIILVLPQNQWVDFRQWGSKQLPS